MYNEDDDNFNEDELKLLEFFDDSIDTFYDRLNGRKDKDDIIRGFKSFMTEYIYRSSLQEIALLMRILMDEPDTAEMNRIQEQFFIILAMRGRTEKRIKRD